MGLYHMRLNSASPLKTEDVERALFHLQRKNPALRVDLRLRENVWWFCEQEGIKVDFKMLSEGTSSEEEIQRMCEGGFPDGATWKFRMIPLGKDAPCAIPEVKGDFPYQYSIMVTGHHALGDGLSASLVAKQMVELLNDVILGCHVSDEVSSRFVQREELGEIESRIIKKLEEDPERHDYVKQTMPTSTPLLLQAFPRPSVDRAATRHLSRIVDVEVTRKFEKQCKSHGVTINSAFSAVINIALIRLVQKSGISQQSYQIASNHAVSMLRYLKRTPRDVVGGYAVLRSHISKVTDNHAKNFWEYATEINGELREGLTSELPLEQKMARLMAQPNHWKEWAQNPPAVVHDYGITNIGHFPMPERRVDDQVLVTDAASVAMVHKYIHMLLFLVHTFRGRCNYSISYATDHIADETAILLADEVMAVYQEVSEVNGM
nr:enniatin synthetase-like [Penaeus vannamei]